MKWENFPLVRFVPFFILGILLNTIRSMFFLSMVCSTTALLLLLVKNIPYAKRYLNGVLVALFAFFFGAIAYQTSPFQTQPTPSLFQQNVEVSGKITYRSSTGKSVWLSSALGQKFQLIGQGVQTFSVGDTVVLCGEVQSIPPSLPWEFNTQRFLRKKGIHHRLHLHETLVHAKTKKTPAPASIFFGIAQAVVKGNKNYAPDEIKTLYKTSGLAHFFAVSGFHVGFVFIVLLRLFHLGKRKTSVMGSGFALLFVWIFVAWVSFPVSGLRAAIMITLVQVGNLMYREQLPIRGVLFSLLLLLIWQPFLVYDLGFWMSHLAVGGILIFHPLLYRKHFFPKWIAWIWEPLLVSIIVQLCLLPILLGFQQGVHINMLITQLTYTFLFPLIFVIGLVGVVLWECGIAFETLWSILDVAMEKIHDFLRFFTIHRWGKALQFSFSTSQTLVFYLHLVALAYFLHEKNKLALKIVTLFSVMLGLTCLFPYRSLPQKQLYYARGKQHLLLNKHNHIWNPIPQQSQPTVWNNTIYDRYVFPPEVGIETCVP